MAEPLIGAAQPAAPDLIKDTTSRSFQKDVIEASAKVPVIVDFWAPWCGPCKQLGPILEKVVKAANGKVKLVKVDIDENPELAQALQIQSIPAVYAFAGGRPVDAFVGAQPESQIKAFVERLTGAIGPSPVDQALEQAKAALAAGEVAAAANLYTQILQHEPGNPLAIAGLSRCHASKGDLKKARDVLDTAGKEHKDHPEISAARAALQLAEQGAKAGDVGPLRAKVEANPADHQARFDLGLALLGQQDYAGAADAFLEIIKRNRTWNEDAARQQLVKMFEALGHKHEVTQSGRRKLSSLLFS